jgi:hypothetical protein
MTLLSSLHHSRKSLFHIFFQVNELLKSRTYTSFFRLDKKHKSIKKRKSIKTRIHHQSKIYNQSNISIHSSLFLFLFLLYNSTKGKKGTDGSACMRFVHYLFEPAKRPFIVVRYYFCLFFFLLLPHRRLLLNPADVPFFFSLASLRFTNTIVCRWFFLFFYSKCSFIIYIHSGISK